jgi:hypothetical protein
MSFEKDNGGNDFAASSFHGCGAARVLLPHAVCPSGMRGSSFAASRWILTDTFVSNTALSLPRCRRCVAATPKPSPAKPWEHPTVGASGQAARTVSSPAGDRCPVANNTGSGSVGRTTTPAAAATLPVSAAPQPQGAASQQSALQQSTASAVNTPGAQSALGMQGGLYGSTGMGYGTGGSMYGGVAGPAMGGYGGSYGAPMG